MIVLDTNVVSEMMKANRDATVARWVANEPISGQFISSITEAELRFGIALLSVGRRQQNLIGALTAMLVEDFAERILPFDSSAASAYAEIAANRRRAGRPISLFDAQIAAIAKSRGASLATRNAGDFQGCGINVINPWDASGGISVS